MASHFSHDSEFFRFAFRFVDLCTVQSWPMFRLMAQKRPAIPARLSARELAELFDVEPSKIKRAARRGYYKKARRNRYDTAAVISGYIGYLIAGEIGSLRFPPVDAEELTAALGAAQLRR